MYDNLTRTNLEFAHSEAEKRIAELDKENAELKEKNQILLGGCEGATMMYEHLTEAKEIIKEFLSYYHSNDYSYQMLEILGKAERFLNISTERQKTKEKNPYRPFKSCNELVYYWEREKVGYSANPLQMIDIWVKHKVDGRRRMIVGFGDNFVEVGAKAKPVTLERLFEMYTFLDDEPCGVKEDKF